MSDTLLESEDARQQHEQIGGEYRCSKCRAEFKTIPDFDRHKCVNQHQVTKSGTCVIPGCPCRGWSAQETVSVKEVNNQPPTPAPDINSLLDQLREQWLEVVKKRDELRETLRAALNSLSRTVRKSYPNYPEEQMQISPTMTVADARAILSNQKGPSA